MCNEMINVKSSNVESVGYDEDLKIVCVKFLNGSLYTYKGVPNSEFNNLKNATSVGSYLNRNFKNVYQYERIS
ncbi:KTSC domain-containing protein [Candidatus Sulfurimonas marisnigri]|uniref:KTSC domain-containing protein n=1 Tax=Candidatus Sulfurimonas marisnigri TaxID=2740405 RepID=A0A7S7RRL8_9BACT|nr:KTSC domain-containing protein [Candidatus Sulfurimonas marisnigri]QOY55710.1 KTSC domain-containing protein [Candidatus Sulfurimonas marisnigri]